MKKPDTKQITFIALMCALSIIVIYLGKFIGGIEIISMLILPLVASLVFIKVDFKYAFVYLIATSLLSLLDIQTCLFLVIPSLIYGLTFGILIKKYFHGYNVVFLTSIVLTILQIGSTFLIKVIYNVDLINTFANILKIQELEFNSLYFLFLYVISLISSSLSYIIITNELKKIDYEFNEKRNQFIPVYLLNIALVCSTIGFYFINNLCFYLLLGITLFYCVVLGYYIFTFYQRKIIYTLQLCLYILCIAAFIIAFFSIDRNLMSLFFLLIPFSHIISGSYIIIYQKLYKKNPIVDEIFDKLD
jgi:hypothetical protein